MLVWIWSGRKGSSVTGYLKALHLGGGSKKAGIIHISQISYFHGSEWLFLCRVQNTNAAWPSLSPTPLGLNLYSVSIEYRLYSDGNIRVWLTAEPFFAFSLIKEKKWISKFGKVHTHTHTHVYKYNVFV